MRCTKALSLIVARQEGWLSANAAGELDRHLASCKECMRAFEADALIARDMARLPDLPARPVTWSAVSASTTRPARRPLARLIVGPAMAATALAALTFVLLRPQAPVTTDPQDGGQQASYATSAHLMLAAADPSADPNRALIALYGDTHPRTAR